MLWNLSFAPKKIMVPQTNFDIIVMGASAGGVEALLTILAALPANFPTPIAIAQHRSTDSQLCMVLQRRTALMVKEAATGDCLEAGTVYLIPAGKHLLLNSSGSLRLSSRLSTRFSPSVDMLFNEAAASFKERCLGVILSGTLDDGAEGAKAIAAAGGRTFVQDQSTSRFFGMPYSAIQTGQVHFVLPLEKIAHALITMVMVKGANSFFTGAMPYSA